MTSELNAAVAAAALGSEERFRELLRSVVEVARAIFAAKASSVLLLDEETSELVFEAVVGEGEEDLVGKRFPAGTGVAGWVLATRTPLVIEDVARDPRFAKDVAEDTGYVPEGLMAVPLLHDERALGVLEVLDRQSRFTLEEMELLGLFATQAAIALDLLQRARRPRRRSPATATSPSLHGSRPPWRRPARTGGPKRNGCSKRWKPSSDANEPGGCRAHSVEPAATELADARLLVVVGGADRGLADRVLVCLDVVVSLVVLADRGLADGGLTDRVLVGLDVLALVLADAGLLELCPTSCALLRSFSAVRGSLL